MEKIKNIIRFLIIRFIELIKTKNKVFNTKYENYIFDNDCKYKNIEIITLKDHQEYKWVGASQYKDNIYFIPNSINRFLKLNTNNNKYEYIDFKSREDFNFKWTGGCVYNDFLYCFPRRSNYLLRMNLKNEIVEEIPLNIKYKYEHHYGGAVTKDGILYQPPRNNNTILVIDLTTMISKEIKIAPKFVRLKYLSSKIHPNGLIYFMPAPGGKIMVLNPKNEDFWFVGDRVNTDTYDCAISKNGIIYGFSGYYDGILKFNPYTNKVSTICKNSNVNGMYGSKLGVNGNIYSISGLNNRFLEFNPETEEIREIAEIEKFDNVICAGGILATNGKIYCAPASDNKIYILNFESKNEINIKNYEFPYVDYY